jgi:hypothetical protein
MSYQQLGRECKRKNSIGVVAFEKSAGIEATATWAS